MRIKKYSANDVEVLNMIGFQQVTGYPISTFAGKAGNDHFRTLEGAKLTRQVLDYERRGLVTINRSSPVRYELALTDQGRKIALKYRARASLLRI